MSRKALWVLLLAVGLVAYCAYIATILRPYFAKVELEVAWELDYRSVSINQIHLGDGGTLFFSTGNYEFIAVSPEGQELYRHPIPGQGNAYGYDDGNNDTLWIAAMDYVDLTQSSVNGQNTPPGSQSTGQVPPGGREFWESTLDRQVGGDLNRRAYPS